MTENIIISVPKSWDDEMKDGLKQKLSEIYFPDDWTFFITNKMDVKIVDTSTMDKMRDNNG